MRKSDVDHARGFIHPETRRIGVSLLLAALIVAQGLRRAPAWGRARVQGRVILSTMFYGEHEDPVLAGGLPQLAAPWMLAYADARIALAATGLARNHLDLRLDLRGRGTGFFDFERKFDPQPLAAPLPVVSARGYTGGPEFEVREATLGIRLGERAELRFGRMRVPEADMLKIDGVKLQLAVGPRWQLAGFVGGAPNPYSRSLFTDYEPPCGSGVASGFSTLPLTTAGTAVDMAGDRCVTAGPQLSLGGGVSARYQYRGLWGSFAIVATGGVSEGDGGAVRIDSARQDRNSLGNLQPPNGAQDAPRMYLSWVNHWQPRQRLDLHSDLLFDALGAGGPQLTRLLLAAALRLLRADRLQLRLTYAHMSSLAIDMFLNRQVYNRAPNGSAPVLNGIGQQVAGIVENNLTVLRTARDELRFNGELRAVAQLRLYLEGRFRSRTLLGGESNETVYLQASYSDFTRSLAGDLTVGLRDSGSLAGVRGGISYLLLRGFRSTNHVLRATLGRSFWNTRLALDLHYVMSAVKDDGAGASACQDILRPNVQGAVVLANLAASAFAPDCYGRRSGLTHEAGLSMLLNQLPWRRLMWVVDYRFSAMLTDPQDGQPLPTLFSHTALLRVELSF